jgi:hypothetical protein
MYHISELNKGRSEMFLNPYPTSVVFIYEAPSKVRNLTSYI